MCIHVAVGMREHGALRRARGPARILQHRNIGARVDFDLLGVAVAGHHLGFEDDFLARRRIQRPRQVLRLEQPEQGGLGHRQKRGEGGDDGALQAPRLEQRLHLAEQHLQVERHHQLGVAVLHLLRQLGDGVERVEVDDRPAGLHHGEEEDDEGRRVRQEQSDLGALAHAEPLQPARGALHLLADLAIGEGLAEEGRAGVVGIGGDRVVEKLVERRDAQRLMPVDAIRIVVEPRHARLRRVGRSRGAAFRHPRASPRQSSKYTPSPLPDR